jgi:hypothetical protein
MLNIWRVDWWVMLRAAMLIAAVALFSFPQLSSAHVESDLDVHASDSERHQSNLATDLLHEIEGHCHSGLECSAQAVFNAWHIAQVYAADLRLSFQLGAISMASQFVLFDPPPPRFLS